MVDYIACRGFYSQKEFFSPQYPFLPWLMTGNLMVKRNAFFHVEGFEETLLRGEDVDFSWRLIQIGIRFKYLPDLEVLHQRPSAFLSFYFKLFRDGLATVLLAHRFGPLSRKSEMAENHVTFAEWFSAVVERFENRMSQILLKKNNLSLFRKIAYLFLAFTGHLVFFLGKGVNHIRYGLIKRPLPVPKLREERDAGHIDPEASSEVRKLGLDVNSSAQTEGLALQGVAESRDS